MNGLATLFAICLVTASSAREELADTLVLCPQPFQAALQPWVAYRQQQGHRILVVTPSGSSFAIQQQIRQVAATNPLRNLVIIGDATNDNGQGKLATVPTDYKIAMVNVQFGGEPDIATDNGYADIDGDGNLDLTIGRIPVDTPEQLRQFIDKVIAYETKSDFGLWRRKINLVAGTGNFVPVIDNLIANTSKQLITELIPACYDTSMTFTNWQSAYCPDPRRLSSCVVDRLNEGCLFWVYIGHGLPDCVAPMEAGRFTFPVLDNKVARRAQTVEGSPIAVFLACYTGAFDLKRDCLGEILVCQPQGPVACLCGSRMTMPYGMATLSYEIMNEFFAQEHATLGEVILCAKQKVAANKIDNDYRQMIEDLGGTFSPNADLLPLERHEHLLMFHLLGDPLLRVPRPSPMEMKAELASDSLTDIHVNGLAPADGELVLDLAYKRDRLRFRPQRRKSFDSSRTELAKYDETYRKSNDLICVSQTLKVNQGTFSAELPIPAAASGECYVRGYLKSNRQAFAQAVPITLK